MRNQRSARYPSFGARAKFALYAGFARPEWGGVVWHSVKADPKPSQIVTDRTLRSSARRRIGWLYRAEGEKVMAKERKGGSRPGRGFWIFMVCCTLGAITLLALLIGGEIQGERVGPNIEHK